MFIDTKYFGKLEIDEGQVITFPKGIPAFEASREFSLISFPDNNIYYCLQSMKQPEIAFLLIHPWDFFPEYEIYIPKEDSVELGIDRQELVQVYNIITIPHSPREMTANLLGPIIINRDTLRGMQIILHESNYGTKHPLFKKEAV